MESVVVMVGDCSMELVRPKLFSALKLSKSKVPGLVKPLQISLKSSMSLAFTSGLSLGYIVLGDDSLG